MNRKLEKIRQKMEASLEEGQIEYVLRGNLTPTTTRILILFVLCLIGIYVSIAILPVHFLLKLVAIAVVLFMAYQCFYTKVYIGKHGRRIFLYKTNLIGMIVNKEDIPINRLQYLSDRRGTTYFTMQVVFDDMNDTIIVKNDNMYMNIFADEVKKRGKR